MKQVYKLTTCKLDGHIQVTYVNSLLSIVEIAFKTPMSEFQFDQFMRLLPYTLDVDKFRFLGLQVEEVQELAANKKIAMFCKEYEKHIGIKYKATRRDGGLIKNVVITEGLLEHYFTSENWTFKGKHSVNNLVRYYNELLQDLSAKSKPRFPGHWSQDYANKLQPTQLGEYWRHLRSLGLKPRKDNVGNIVDWV